MNSVVLHSIYKIVKNLIIKNGLDCAVSDLQKNIMVHCKNILEKFERSEEVGNRITTEMTGQVNLLNLKEYSYEIFFKDMIMCLFNSALRFGNGTGLRINSPPPTIQF